MGKGEDICIWGLGSSVNGWMNSGVNSLKQEHKRRRFGEGQRKVSGV